VTETATPTDLSDGCVVSSGYLRIENAEGYVLIAMYLFIYLLFIYLFIYLFVCVLFANLKKY